MTAVLVLLYLSTTDYIAQVIFPHALIGLLPLILILPSTKLPPTFILIELLLIAAFLFLLQYFTKGLGTGDIEFILVTDLLWHWEITAQIIFCGCLFTLLFFLIKKGRRQPLIPGLAFGFFLELFFRL
jgi:Flp pilus assembly protein protease CpaA